MLAISRIMVAWQPVGLAMGVYDMANRYLKQREQFGNPLAAYQVTFQGSAFACFANDAAAIVRWLVWTLRYCAWFHALCHRRQIWIKVPQLAESNAKAWNGPVWCKQGMLDSLS